jgi:hypothetical protein
MSNIRGQGPGIGIGGVHEMCSTISAKRFCSALRINIERKSCIFLTSYSWKRRGLLYLLYISQCELNCTTWISLAACTSRRVGAYPTETESWHRRTQIRPSISAWSTTLPLSFFLDIHLLQLIMAVSSIQDPVTEVPKSLPNPPFSWILNNNPQVWS